MTQTHSKVDAQIIKAELELLENYQKRKESNWNRTVRFTRGKSNNKYNKIPSDNGDHLISNYDNVAITDLMRTFHILY